jgi:hypothetical protein
MTLIPLLAALMSANATISGSPGVAVTSPVLQGLPLCVWNDSSLFSKLKKGMQERSDRLFRFPNGSYSDIYHWNGTGKYSADSTWIPDDATYTPGWAGASAHRGITSSSDASLISDGDTTTYWWSNPEHPDAPGWFYMALGDSIFANLGQGLAKSIDEISLWLGDARPDSIQIVRWSSNSGTYPYPYQQAADKWIEVARLPAAAYVDYKFASPTNVYYLGVRPIGKLDNGWQVRELKALKNGQEVSANVASAKDQTPIFAISTHPSTRNKNLSFTWDFDAYMKWIQAYPNAAPMVCVNYGTGTPQEAAAWVHYANKVKNYGIKRWQIGNETSGNWEEAGCVSARQYATRFVAYAKAMKAEDPTIEIEGPVLAGTDFSTLASGDYDGRSWLQGFLHYVDSVEKASGSPRLVDGIDFHNYAYWFASTPNVKSMIAAADANGAAYDTLISLMAANIADPTSRKVLMSEFNTSTVSSSLEMQASAGTAVGLQFAHFIQRFGDRGATNLWDLYEGGGLGPDGTYGSLSAFTNPTQGEWSSLNNPPNASFWTTRTIMRQWLDTAGGDTVMSIDQSTGLRTFAVRNAGRVSVLAFNLGKDSTALPLEPTLFPNGGDILSWGTGEYSWNGSNEQAQAVPDNGPSSKAFTALGTIKVPPYGMLVVRGAGRDKQAPHTSHWLLSNRKIASGDTLTVAGWTSCEGSTLKSGTWSIGGVSGALATTDGAWDGPSESWIAKIPADAIASGTLTVSIVSAAGDLAKDSATILVTSGIRPVLLISDFETKKAVTTWGKSYYAFGSEDNTNKIKFDSAGRGSWYLKDSMSLIKQDTLDYTYESIALPMPSAKVLDSLNSLYDIAGLVFDINTRYVGGSGTFTISADLPAAMTAYNSHGTTLPNTNGTWKRDTVLFSNLSQASGWGKICDFVFDSVQQVQFRAGSAGNALILLDNVAFLGTKGDAISLAIHPVAKTGLLAPLAMAGNLLSVNVAGPWTLRLVSADGRLSERQNGLGASMVSLRRSTSPQWAILEGQGVRQILAIPPVMR